MECDKLFETSFNVNGSVTTFITVSIVLLLASVYAYLFERKFFLLPAMMLFVFLAFFLAYILEYLELAEALEKSRHAISCGVVSVLQRESTFGDPPDDIIKVGKTKFVIIGDEGTSAYNKTIEIGGILDDGVKVRLAHYNGKILRVEVCSELPNSCSSRNE